MRPNAVKQLWRDGGCASNIWLTAGSAVIAEFTGHLGYQSATVDAQHGFGDDTEMLTMIQALAATETIPFVRLSWNDPARIMRALDAGAYGLICPMVNSAEDAASFVRYAKYPPEGERSWGPHRAMLYAGAEYRQKFNDELALLPQIETRAGYDALEDIVRTPGIDGVLVGPSDLALSLGFDPVADPTEPAVLDAIEDIARRCRIEKCVAGIFCGSVEMARRCRDRGYQFITFAVDIGAMTKAAKAALEAFEA